MSIPESEEVRKAHIWQNFRIQCMTLAVQSGALPGDLTAMADVISEYILTKSSRELNNDKGKKDE